MKCLSYGYFQRSEFLEECTGKMSLLILKIGYLVMCISSRLSLFDLLSDMNGCICSSTEFCIFLSSCLLSVLSHCVSVDCDSTG